jgi:peroxiredoxin
MLPALLALALVSAPAFAEDMAAEDKAAEDTAKAPDFELKDSNGKSHKLSDFNGKWVVLEWMNYDCPFVKKHYDASVKNMQTLQKTYTAKGIVWLSICSSAEGKQGYMDQELAAKRLEEQGAKPTALLLDPTGTVGRAYGAKVTPEMRIVDPKGNVVYSGAIDSVRSKDPADVEGATNYIAQMLDAALDGEEVEATTNKAYG